MGKTLSRGYNMLVSKLKYTKEVLEQAVKKNVSMLGVMRTLEASLTSGALRTYLIERIKFFKIDTSHFLGQAWNYGENHIGGSKKRSPQEILVVQSNSTRVKGRLLKRALLEIGREYKCNNCQLSKWRKRTLRLEVEHINSNPLDNRPENLCFLCPNCHSQTENFCKLPQ